MDDPTVHRRLTAILAADVVTYSRLMARDEAGTHAAWKSHRKDLIDPKIVEYEGRIVKLTGDGFLAEFPSVVNAVTCAATVQRGMLQRNVDVPRPSRIELRMGINLGDVIVESDDIFGDGVNVAVRLEKIAAPGGIAVSAAVRDNVGNRLDLRFEDMGEQALKNIDRPVRAYSISLDFPAAQRAVGSDAGTREPWEIEKPSIAVLPFNNISGDPEQEYFSDGITEDIITDLSKISGLFVVARNTAYTYKNKPVKVQQVSQDLRVGYILEGSVRRVGSRVRVTAQLVEGKGGGPLWADRYDWDLTEIFALQDEITHTIVDHLKVKLLPEEKKDIGRVPTGNFEAYAYYLRGRQFLHWHSKSHYVLAKRMFAMAVKLDPLYARAYAGIADCDSFLFLHYNADVSIDGILATSAKALDLESGLAEAHASLGLALSLRERHSEAMAEFDQAIALDPDLFEAHYFYARACFTQGKLDEAARLFQRAADIKPDDYQALLVLINVLRSLGREQEMNAAAREGVARAERELMMRPENPRPAYLGAVGLAALGELDRAKEWAVRALAIDPDDRLAKYNVACFYSLQGEPDRAIDLLIELLPGATHETKRWVKYDSDLDPLRSHARFPMVLELLG
ncbi:adenylate/guanylate cyclase domain-containing protein [Sinorhizobium meliloti]|uniref:adenylate/guanylate cyclase domain-containing protein n=1 Tax=Rhizobium meliloti TaxID=382 RepID=UPI0001E4B149|nr:adenylate/guanylate cyclase domain-containing protein [Sinorhizobium meliloti]AEG56851.1 adenylate/guanylate cyclase with TPR repeats [Sinorhizobium meliloti AK83]ASP95399.1 adenylate/guanylate cyclase domain-containing protein [Sinorhizobium meliloti]MDE3764993.1 tetratricopeptide repeat protein [Sinorhizobium meliloti]MDE3778763.1 tetratricopeptide repeat protein [Sinorhizobium meliloti]MDE3802944.1 tetratricopeptide repeat protein [Sinorhizobium meliloti]